MNKVISIICLALLLLLAAGCYPSTPEPAPDTNAIATSVAATMAAQQGEQQNDDNSSEPAVEPTSDANAIATSVAATIAAQQDDQQNNDNNNEPTVEPTLEPTVDPYTIFAPDPLGVEYTGFIFDFGTCFDMDNFQPVGVNDPECDFLSDQYGAVTPQNGALISGYATMEPPSFGKCMDADLSPDYLATQTDLYLCFKTSQGSYGFLVGRDYQVNQNRLIFDMYIFP